MLEGQHVRMTAGAAAASLVCEAFKKCLVQCLAFQIYHHMLENIMFMICLSDFLVEMLEKYFISRVLTLYHPFICFKVWLIK